MNERADEIESGEHTQEMFSKTQPPGFTKDMMRLESK